jgi:hypothetical protein
MAFKNNARLTELAFPPSLTVHQRKQLHFLSDHIGGCVRVACVRVSVCENEMT